MAGVIFSCKHAARHGNTGVLGPCGRMLWELVVYTEVSGKEESRKKTAAKEPLVVASKVKAYIKSKGMMTSSGR